jgi:hypothetical protein
VSLNECIMRSERLELADNNMSDRTRAETEKVVS